MKLEDIDKDALIRLHAYHNRLGMSIQQISNIFSLTHEDAIKAVAKGRQLCNSAPTSS